jgi:hypothetical protein
MASQPILPIRFLGGAAWAGVQLVNSECRIGTGGTAVADTATTSVVLPKPAVTSCQLVSLSINAITAAASAGGVVTAQVFKRNNVPAVPTNVTLTATRSIEADVITVGSTTYAFAITATSVQNLTFQFSDLCRIDIVAASSLETAPVLTFTGLWAIINP